MRDVWGLDPPPRRTWLAGLAGLAVVLAPFALVGLFVVILSEMTQKKKLPQLPECRTIYGAPTSGCITVDTGPKCGCEWSVCPTHYPGETCYRVTCRERS